MVTKMIYSYKSISYGTSMRSTMLYVLTVTIPISFVSIVEVLYKCLSSPHGRTVIYYLGMLPSSAT